MRGRSSTSRELRSEGRGRCSPWAAQGETKPAADREDQRLMSTAMTAKSWAPPRSSPSETN